MDLNQAKQIAIDELCRDYRQSIELEPCEMPEGGSIIFVR